MNQFLRHRKHPADLSPQDWNLYMKAKKVLWSIDNGQQCEMAKNWIDRVVDILCPILPTDQGHVMHNEEIQSELYGIWRMKVKNPQYEDPFKHTNKDQKDG